MTTQLSTIDPSGKVELPRQMRDALGLAPGTTVVLELAERSISIRQQSDLAVIQENEITWVLSADKHFDCFDFVKRIDPGDQPSAEASTQTQATEMKS